MLWFPVLCFPVLWAHCVVVSSVLWLTVLLCGSSVCCGSQCCCVVVLARGVPNLPLEGCGVVPSPLYEVVQDSRIMHT